MELNIEAISDDIIWTDLNIVLSGERHGMKFLLQYYLHKLKTHAYKQFYKNSYREEDILQTLKNDCLRRGTEEQEYRRREKGLHE